MNKKIVINLPDGAREPTDNDVREAKNYILRRSETSILAQDRAGDLILDAAEQLVRIAYRYDIPVSRFQFDGSVSEDMMDEVDAVMNELEEALYDGIGDYATICTNDSNRIAILLVFLHALGHRSMNLRQTLQAYEWRTLRQVEALIASYKAEGLSITNAIGRIKADLASFSASRELQSALKHPNDFAAPYIRNGGKATFPDGSQNVQGVYVEGYNAIKFIYGTAVAQIWMRNRLLDIQENEGCMGYYVLRGSEYPCPHICEPQVGYHDKDDAEGMPPYHPNCYCYVVNIYKNGQI